MVVSLLLLAAQSAAAPDDPLAKCLWIGYAVKPYGDWDKDGHADFLVSAPRDWPKPAMPTVALISGKDGHALLVMHGESEFGRQLSVLGDIDDDHFPEIVAGCYQHGTRVFSGRDGKSLYSIDCTDCAVVPDVNGDKHDDFVVLTQKVDEAKLATTKIELRSGVDGAPIRTLLERNDDDVIVLGILDCNGDGCGDVAAGFTSTWQHAAPFAQIEIISGRDGAVLATRKLDVACSLPSISLADVGELDGDGKPQVVVGLFYDEGGRDGYRAGKLPPGEVLLLSTPTLRTKHGLHADEAVNCNGKSLAGGFDVNDDGHADVLVTEYPFEWGVQKRPDRPRLRVYSGLDGSLLRTQEGSHTFGRTVAWVGDVDADGTPDYAVASLYDRDDTSVDADVLQVFSGKTGEQLLLLPGKAKR